MAIRSAWLGVLLIALGSLVMDTSLKLANAAEIDNVAAQWNRLFCNLYCTSNATSVEPNIVFAHLHLAQWHALLALNDTGSCTTQEAVVAYASHKILANYFPFQLDSRIDPLLLTQLNGLNLSESQEKLGKRLGESAALALIRKRIPAREFSLQAFKAALNEGEEHLIPGVYRYENNTPAGRDAATFLYYTLTTEQPYVLPDPLDFIATYLSDIKPVKVPSEEWDAQYDMLKVIGRAGPGRPLDWNVTGQLISLCTLFGSPYLCLIETRWAAIARSVLPTTTSLYDTVLLFAKLSVSMHDALIVFTNLQHGYWFWRPVMAYRAGDPNHAPIPDWTPFLTLTPPHAEYPSGSVTSTATAATVLQNYFGKDDVPYTLEIGGVGPTCSPPGFATRHYKSFSENVHETQLARMYAGHHFNKSVMDAATVGATVANYIDKHWAQTTPSGVLPETPYLNVHIKLPGKQGDWSPIKLEL